MTKELEELYVNRPLEEEDFTFEQWFKIRELRIKSELASKCKKDTITLYRDVVEIGDPVYFRIGDKKNKNLQGYVINIRNKKNIWKKSVDISSALGTFNNISMSDVWYRKIKDMTEVEIPVELTKISTDRLLKCYKSVLRTNSWVFINGKDYYPHVIKAELSKREHIFSNEDKKIMKSRK